MAKKIVSIIAIILAILVFAGGVLALFFVSFANNKTTLDLPVEMQAAKIVSSALSETEYEQYGVSDDAESAYKLTLALVPEYTTFPFTWSCKWLNEKSDWAVGKNVNDYVRFVYIDNAENTAVLECLKPFGERVNVVATTGIVKTVEGQKQVTVNCNCDYVKRIVDFKAFQVVANENKFLFDSSTDVFEIAYGTGGGVDTVGVKLLEPAYSDYTMEHSSSTVGCLYRLNPKLIPLFENALYEATGKQFKFDETHRRKEILQFNKIVGFLGMAGLMNSFFKPFLTEDSASYINIDRNAILQVLADNPDEPFLFFDIESSVYFSLTTYSDNKRPSVCFTVGMRYTSESLAAALGGN